MVDFITNFKSLGGMITGAKGIGSVAATGVMFIFSILFFGILTDAGTFRPIIGGILNLVGTDPIKIAIGTAILAAIVHSGRLRRGHLPDLRARSAAPV